MPKSSWQLGVLALAVAVVLVPTIARARQHVERRETTRLSIRHSWVGIAPPTKSAKAAVAPTHFVVVPILAVRVEVTASVSRVPDAPASGRHPVLDQSPDPLRGPPASARLS